MDGLTVASRKVFLFLRGDRVVGSLTVPTLSLLFLLTWSFGLLVDCCGMFDSVCGSMTWVGDFGSIIPWSALSSTWDSVTEETGIGCNT